MRLNRVFIDCDLRCSFEGLRLVAKKAKTDLTDTTVLFMNRKATAFKVIVNNGYCVYYKNGNRRIPLDALRFLPVTFGGTELEMDRAIRASLTEKLKLTEKETSAWADTRRTSRGTQSTRDAARV